MDPDDSSDTSVIILDEENDKTTYIPESLLDPSAQRVLKAPSSEGNPKYLANVGDDDLFNACVMVLADADTTSVEAFQALEALEELVHQIDFGVRFAEGEGMEETVRWLESTDPAVKGKVAMVISAAVQVRNFRLWDIHAFFLAASLYPLGSGTCTFSTLTL